MMVSGLCARSSFCTSCSRDGPAHHYWHLLILLHNPNLFCIEHSFWWRDSTICTGTSWVPIMASKTLSRSKGFPSYWGMFLSSMDVRPESTRMPQSAPDDRLPGTLQRLSTRCQMTDTWNISIKVGTCSVWLEVGSQRTVWCSCCRMLEQSNIILMLLSPSNGWIVSPPLKVVKSHHIPLVQSVSSCLLCFLPLLLL